MVTCNATQTERLAWHNNTAPRTNILCDIMYIIQTKLVEELSTSSADKNGILTWTDCSSAEAVDGDLHGVGWSGRGTLCRSWEWRQEAPLETSKEMGSHDCLIVPDIAWILTSAECETVCNSKQPTIAPTLLPLDAGPLHLHAPPWKSQHACYLYQKLLSGWCSHGVKHINGTYLTTDVTYRNPVVSTNIKNLYKPLGRWWQCWQEG